LHLKYFFGNFFSNIFVQSQETHVQTTAADELKSQASGKQILHLGALRSREFES
jgi:hypothetical protein